MRPKAKLLYGAELCLIILSLAVCSELLAGRAETAGVVTPQQVAASDRARHDLVRAFQLVSGKTGWALTKTRLLWTINSGRQWKDITPPLPGGKVLGAFFLDASNGWCVLAAADERTGTNYLTLASTSNGGGTWSYAGLLSPTDYVQDEPSSDVSIHFADSGHGWVLVKLASGSNFSRGLLFVSADGGDSWSRLPEPPSAGPVRFATDKDGWLAGGPEARSLYVTRDGGLTWTPVSIDTLGGGLQTSEPHFDLPSFRNQDEGTLPVTLVGAAGVAVRFYETSDRGKTWRLKQTVPVSDGAPRSTRVASAVVSSNLFVVASPGGPRVRVVEKGKTSNRDVAVKEPDAVISGLDFKSRATGWILTRAGRCEGFKTQCGQETKLFATDDGGETLTDVTPQSPNGLPPGDGDSSDTIPGPGSVVTSRNRKGFDKCAADTVSNMLVWWNNSPYFDANIYIGGVNRGCSQSNLTSSWVSQVFAQGWGLIPTWVGPQATCTTCTTCSVMSSDPTTAATQGTSEANSASNAAAALGLTNTIIYYDMERYNPTTSCQNSVRAFLNAWVQQTHARGNLAGVYGSPQNAQDDWSVIANPPDAVWIAKWDLNASVWGLTPLSDSLWVNDQRIHQYQGGHNETYGGVTFNIDNDFDDAPVAAPSSSQSLPNLTPYQPSGWSDKIVVSNTTGTSTDTGSPKTTDTLYVDWAVINNGTAATGATFYTRLYVDGVERTNWFTNPPMNVNNYAFVQDYSIGTLGAGTHTIKITTDATATVSESSESDNEYTKTITVVSPGQPNLTPYQPSGWSDKIVVSNVTGTGSDSSPLRTTDTIYVDWAAINNGAAATGATFYTKLYVDGVERTAWFTDPPLNVNNYIYVQDYSIGSLSAGTHTIKVVTDATATVSESNESDNEYTKTITVTSPGQPNLTPHQPSGWSDKIVVSNTTGTSADAASLKATDTLYVDWAVINNGVAATGATFYTRLLVDGVEKTSWFTDPPLNVNFYIYIQDYAIGSLSAGTHTIKIVADSTGAVAESNESDNEYTKTITVAPQTSCFMLTTNVSPAGGGTISRNVQPNCSGGGASASTQDASPRDIVAGRTPAPRAAGTSPGPVVQRTAVAEETFRRLISKAEETGSVRVIVGLGVPFVPEGALTASQARSQSARIAQAQDNLLSRLSALGARSAKKFPFIPYMAVEVDARGLQHLQASSDVVSIEEDRIIPPTLAESVSLIGAPTAWAGGFSGAGQAVAILDTGVDKTHPFLSGKVVSEACYSSNLCPGGGTSSTSAGSGVNCSTSISGCDHGTHVAGIAAGKGSSFSGVAKDASIIAIQVFSRFDNQSQCGSRPAPCALTFTSDYILGLQRVQALSGSFNIAAANMSLGGGKFTSNCDSSESATKAAIDGLRSLGIATVIASGNDGYSDGLGSPGCISTAVSVGSTDDGSLGTTADGVSDFSNSASFLHLLAPGRWISSSVPGGNYSNFSGTSMAAPHVTGAWAVLKSKAPTASVDQVLSALTTTGKPVNDSRNNITKPRIQVDAAANALAGGQYAQGTTVTLTATPTAGYSFQSWSGCDSTSGTNCTVTMNSGKTVTANFALSPPQAPTANAATNVTGSGFTANWGSSSGATGYRLDVSTSNSFGGFVSGYQDLDVGNTLSRAVSGLSAGTTYYYRVRAYNAGGTSGNSNTTSVTTTATAALRIDNVAPKAGRATGGQTVTLTGAFAGLSSISIGGTLVSWSYTSGTSAVAFTTPAHAVGAVDIVLTPTSGSTLTRSRAFAYLPTVFTDNTLTVGITTAKAQHVTELRQAIDALRAVAGLSPAPWTELTLFNFVTQIKVGHIQEMRTYLEEAAVSLGYPAASYTDAQLGAGSVIKRVHIEELRQRIRVIAG
ncbi:MAG TPA: glycoside hydrolase domain-containing protein [Pyrinomonadaceae bacterium]